MVLSGHVQAVRSNKPVIAESRWEGSLFMWLSVRLLYLLSIDTHLEPAPKPPKPERPPASQPACHEVAGYMPGRREFETEWENDAEQMIKDIEFLDSDTPEDVGKAL